MLKLGLIGEKLAHTISPEIHKRLMKSNHIEGTYDILEMSQETFPLEFDNLKKSDYSGVNITIPYKESVLPLLDEISPQAKYIGAVNTVAFKDGQAIGYNTDYDGFVSLLQTNHIPVKGKEAIILGSGGAAKAAIKALLDLGIFDITIVSRAKQNFHSHYTISYEYFTETKQKSDILINCTPVGMFPNVEASPIAKNLINAQVVVDLIYNPKETLFLKYAKSLGCTTLNGELMLEKQAIEAQKIWTSINNHHSL